MIFHIKAINIINSLYHGTTVPRTHLLKKVDGNKWGEISGKKYVGRGMCGMCMFFFFFIIIIL